MSLSPINSLPDDPLLEILLEVGDPSVAGVSRRFRVLANSPQFYNGILARIFKSLEPSDLAHLRVILNPQNPSLQNVKEIFQKIVGQHREKAGTAATIHPNLPLLSTERLVAILGALKKLDEEKFIDTLILSNMQSEEDRAAFSAQTLEEKRAWMYSIPEQLATIRFWPHTRASLKLDFLPKCIELFSRLDSLPCDSCALSTLPEEIGALTALQSLSLSSSHLTALPTSFSGLISLRQLRLDNNNFRTFPEQICSLPELSSLSLDSNDLSDLPMSITALTKLNYLSIKNNHFDVLPEEIFPLVALQFLDLSSNDLSALPEEISALTNLKELRLDHNRLEVLPEGIRALTMLHTLGLNNNRLSTISPNIMLLTNLHSLGLDGNAIASIPRGISALTSLRALGICGNQLEVLPPEICELTALEHLAFKNNRLRTLPGGVTAFTNLERLDLRENPFESLPSGILKLPQLQHCILQADDAPYQGAMGLYKRLLQREKNIVHGLIAQFAQDDGVIIDAEPNDWGKIHILEDVTRFQKVMHQYVEGLFEALSEEQRKSVTEEVIQFYVSKEEKTAEWALEHLFDDLSLLAWKIREVRRKEG